MPHIRASFSCTKPPICWWLVDWWQHMFAATFFLPFLYQYAILDKVYSIFSNLRSIQFLCQWFFWEQEFKITKQINPHEMSLLFWLFNTHNFPSFSHRFALGFLNHRAPWRQVLLAPPQWQVAPLRRPAGAPGGGSSGLGGGQGGLRRSVRDVTGEGRVLDLVKCPRRNKMKNNR